MMKVAQKRHSTNTAKTSITSKKKQPSKKKSSQQHRRSITTARIITKPKTRAATAFIKQKSPTPTHINKKHFSSINTNFHPQDIIQAQQPVDLNFRKYTSSTEQTSKPPLVILHGLLGHANNWANIASRADLRDGREIYAVDLRNHGLSTHSHYIDYIAMANDVSALIQKECGGVATVCGHSMGGKVATAMGLLHPHLVSGVVVVDILPVQYPEESMEEIHSILKAVVGVDFSNGVNRREIEQQLRVNGVQDSGIRQWLLTNVRSVDSTDDIAKSRGQVVKWKPNVHALKECYEHIRNFDLQQAILFPYEGPSHLILGGRSSFGHRDTALDIMHEKMPGCTLSVIEDAGHWCHAEKPHDFSAQLVGFLNQHKL